MLEGRLVLSFVGLGQMRVDGDFYTGSVWMILSV